MKSNYDIARRRVKKKNEFRAHLASYVVIIAFLFIINLLTSPGYLWAAWPALGWGIGLVFHAMEVYGLIADKEKEEEMIEQEVRRIERTDSDDFLEDEPLELPEIKKETLYDEEDLV